jgi:chitosanase
MNLTSVNKKTIEAILTVFETGRYTSVSYGAVANIRGDRGGLSYGKHQASITSGNLYLLLQRYIVAKGQYAKDLAPYMPKIKAKSNSVVSTTLMNLLKQAGLDPIMQMVQDDFFYDQFFAPSLNVVNRYGFTQPLSCGVVFDSMVHGSWGAMRDRTLEKARINDEKTWIKTYLDVRRAWLAGKGGPLAATVYRPDTFLAMIKKSNWQMNLPILCHGVTLTAAMLQINNPVEAPIATVPEDDMVKAIEAPVLMVDDKDKAKPNEGEITISDVQRYLLKAGYYKMRIDGIFGDAMDKAVRAFQKDNGLNPDGIVGNMTLDKMDLL